MISWRLGTGVWGYLCEALGPGMSTQHGARLVRCIGSGCFLVRLRKRWHVASSDSNSMLVDCCQLHTQLLPRTSSNMCCFFFSIVVRGEAATHWQVDNERDDQAGRRLASRRRAHTEKTERWWVGRNITVADWKRECMRAWVDDCGRNGTSSDCAIILSSH